jgi:alkylation response protein AidB-like acyl-CoA dehydrogenase
MAAPTICTSGSEEQKRKYLPRMMDGTHIWCQGFSEPGAGSDLSNVSTTAIRNGDHYIVNGQKVWTSMGHMADYCIMLVRTDPAASKHKGLSYLLVNLKTPGVEVRRMTQITGESEFCEVFLDNVKVPVENLVGEEGKGWMIAITTLMFERVLGDVTKAAKYGFSIKKMIQMARTVKRSGKPVFNDLFFRQQLAKNYINIMVLKMHGLRNLSGILKSGIPGPEGSITKLLWSLTNQDLCDNAVMMLGPVGQIAGESETAFNGGFWQYHFLRSKANTIEAGTSEILKNIIAERILGLPKDFSRANIKE